MTGELLRNAKHHRSCSAFLALAALLAIFVAAPQLRGDVTVLQSARFFHAAPSASPR